MITGLKKRWSPKTPSPPKSSSRWFVAATFGATGRKWQGLWLIDSHNGHGSVPAINVDNYPAVQSHLDRYYEQLAKRYDKGSTPYNLRNCAYHADFAKEKLLWMDMSDRKARFAYEDGETFCLTHGFSDRRAAQVPVCFAELQTDYLVHGTHCTKLRYGSDQVDRSHG